MSVVQLIELAPDSHGMNDWMLRSLSMSSGAPGEKAPPRAMQRIALKVNGRRHIVTVDPDTPLLFVLNDELGLRGPRFGCGMAQCGACTVLMRGHVVRSCVKPVSAVFDDEITTLEGLGTPEAPHPIQQAFIEEGAAQCGFCLSGVILTAKAVLDVKPNASDQEIRQALGGVLCRCFAHTRMMRAIRKYAEARKRSALAS
jgi:nicotinate dehydrogenase subunit A